MLVLCPDNPYTGQTYMTTIIDEHYLKYALEIAARGFYTVSPNPMVGCVIVKDDVIVGEGYHQRAGGAHAEILALQQAQERAQGATAYVTLEPCCHIGRTGPCTDALIAAGIKRVIICCLDPNPLINGQGMAALLAAGIKVEVGLLADQAAQLNQRFFYYITHQRPFVIAKWAMSLDGKTVTHPRDNRFISSGQSQQHAHHIRQSVDAILIGAKTALHDDPQLTVRHSATDDAPLRQPLRIILTGKRALPTHLKLFNDSDAKTMVVTTQSSNQQWHRCLQDKGIDILIAPATEDDRIHLPSLLSLLAQKKISSLLVEGGMQTHAQFFKENLVNQVDVYLAPVIIGDAPTKQALTNIKLNSIANDYHLSAQLGVNDHV